MKGKKRKILIVVPMGLILLSLVGCTKKEPDTGADEKPVVQFVDEGSEASVGM